MITDFQVFSISRLNWKRRRAFIGLSARRGEGWEGGGGCFIGFGFCSRF